MKPPNMRLGASLASQGGYRSMRRWKATQGVFAFQYKCMLTLYYSSILYSELQKCLRGDSRCTMQLSWSAAPTRTLRALWLARLHAYQPRRESLARGILEGKFYVASKVTFTWRPRARARRCKVSIEGLPCGRSSLAMACWETFTFLASCVCVKCMSSRIHRTCTATATFGATATGIPLFALGRGGDSPSTRCASSQPERASSAMERTSSLESPKVWQPGQSVNDASQCLPSWIMRARYCIDSSLGEADTRLFLDALEGARWKVFPGVRNGDLTGLAGVPKVMVRTRHAGEFPTVSVQGLDNFPRRHARSVHDIGCLRYRERMAAKRGAKLVKKDSAIWIAEAIKLGPLLTAFNIALDRYRLYSFGYGRSQLAPRLFRAQSEVSRSPSCQHRRTDFHAVGKRKGHGCSILTDKATMRTLLTRHTPPNAQECSENASRFRRLPLAHSSGLIHQERNTQRCLWVSLAMGDFVRNDSKRKRMGNR
jgi:hypothetical protein